MLSAAGDPMDTPVQGQGRLGAVLPSWGPRGRWGWSVGAFALSLSPGKEKPCARLLSVWKPGFILVSHFQALG